MSDFRNAGVGGRFSNSVPAQPKIILPYQLWAKFVYGQIALQALASQPRASNVTLKASQQMNAAVEEIDHDGNLGPVPKVPEPTWGQDPPPVWEGNTA